MAFRVIKRFLQRLRNDSNLYFSQALRKGWAYCFFGGFKKFSQGMFINIFEKEFLDPSSPLVVSNFYRLIDSKPLTFFRIGRMNPILKNVSD